MKRKLIFAMTFAALAVVPAAFADETSTSTLGLTVGAEASFSTAFTATSLTTAAGGKFGAYSGTTNFNYKIRTATSGSITVQVVDFEANGPLIADLSFTCTATTPGTACSSTPASTTLAKDVVTFGADAHSTDAGDAGSVSWTLVNRPTVKTGTYSSVATFTISAT